MAVIHLDFKILIRWWTAMYDLVQYEQSSYTKNKNQIFRIKISVQFWLYHVD